MKTTLDKFGRVVLPKLMRNRLGLRPGDKLEVRDEGRCIVIQKEPSEPDLQYEDGVLVYVGEVAEEDLDVQEAIRRSREGRAAKLMGPAT